MTRTNHDTRSASRARPPSASTASRSCSSGIRRHDELTVTVSDERNGAYFELAAEPHQALDVFNHPYAHAAFQGLPDPEALAA